MFQGPDKRAALKFLFPNGIENLHTAQGSLPDCQLLSVLHGLARYPGGADKLKSLISPKPNGDFNIHFPGEEEPITVTRDELKHDFERYAETHPLRNGEEKSPQDRRRTGEQRGYLPAHDQGESPGVRLFEIAYARLMKRSCPKRFAHIPDERILEIYDQKAGDGEKEQYHYSAAQVLQDLTGWQPETTIGHFRMAEMLARKEKHPQKTLLIAETRTAPEPERNPFLDSGRMIRGWHAFVVDAVDMSAKTVLLRDPHNTRIGLQVDLDDFYVWVNGMVAYPDNRSPEEM